MLSSTATGNYEFSHRPHDEFLWPEGAEPLPIPCWGTFRKIWKETCNHIRIRRKCEDTCPECFVLKNKFRYLPAAPREQVARSHNAASSSSSSSSDDDDESVSSASDATVYPSEELIEQACEHAEQAQQQRRLAKDRQLTAMGEAHLPHENRRFVFLL